MLTKLIDLGYVGTGTTPSMKNPDYYNSNDILFIKPSDIYDNAVSEIVQSEFFISSNARQKARIFPKNTILCVCIGSIGKIGITTKESSCNQQINYIIPNEKHNAKFIAYSLFSRKDELIRIGSDGPVVPIINKSRFENIEIITFDYEKETEVANELDNINNIIDLKKKELLSLDELIKSRFIEMFETIDLSEQRNYWKELGTVSKIHTGTTPSTKEPKNWDGDILWITPAEMNQDTFYIYDTVRKITETGRKSKSLDLMPINTVLLSTRAPIGKVGIVGKPMTCNQGFKNFECSNEINPVFLYTLLKNNTEYLNSLGSGTTFLEVSKSKISKMLIPVPNIELQKQFELYVKQIDKSKFVYYSRYFL